MMYEKYDSVEIFHGDRWGTGIWLGRFWFFTWINVIRIRVSSWSTKPDYISVWKFGKNVRPQPDGA